MIVLAQSITFLLLDRIVVKHCLESIMLLQRPDIGVRHRVFGAGSTPVVDSQVSGLH